MSQTIVYKPSTTIKVMSFNIRADNILDIKNRWKKRSSLVYDIINKYECDIVGLQEVTEQMYRGINSNINLYNMMGDGRTKKFFSERNNLLIKKKYHVVESETFWLSKTPYKKSSSVWYSLFPRICTTAVIKLENNKRIRIYNTHLDCLLPQARAYGLKRIIEAIEEHYAKDKLPCILMGDFNATPNSHLIKDFSKGILTNKKFIAVQDADTKLYESTTMGKFRGKEKGMHIDYIFVSEDFNIEDVQIIKYNKQGKYPSDHYPIVATLTL